MKSRISLIVCTASALCLLGLTACGSGSGTDTEATAPSDLNKPATGTLRVFAYEDSVTPEMMKPFERQNPDLSVKTASFDSDAEAAAKLAGGFKADVVEICADESSDLVDRNLIRPLDPSGVSQWNNTAFHGSPIVRSKGKVIFVPLSAGPNGLIYNTKEVPGGINSFADLYDPKFKGRASLEGDYALVPIAETALALGIKDPMNLSDAQLSRVSDYMDAHRSQFRSLWSSDSDLTNLFKSGEISVSDGGVSVADKLQKEGVPVKWVAPKEGALSWVCGFGLTAKSQNIDAAYRLINWQASARAQAIRARNGYVVTNKTAMPLVPARYKATADPSSLDEAIPETRPSNYKDWIKAFESFQTG